ncbi:iron(III) transport system ATP-binding protein [Hypnocyclicus thermotrophus]|uniref:Iron(III) transport system ATP-binding protein n=1 Tax=Hypnocyclicus thermotrophus TaxID=1627895 RepID=A0AA46DYR3_9FUSO|nr:ABC transporter ATP-binding protein [Hypnocyclicus thermotrophus]TDT70592.1 iron(III) transport system ATP-binding protein [Hypnocyclicus thermotrophus]
MEYIKLENISFKYGKKIILDNISFSIKKGEVLAILGESGSGKSTILRIISGLETPKTGKITIDNHIIFNKNINFPPEKRNLGMVFQDYALFPHLNIEKNITFGISHFNKKTKKIILNKMLKLVKLEEHSKKYPHELSGGQQQRIAIARTLATNPKLLLLDEPFSNLDANLQSSIRKEIKSIIDIEKTTTIFVTHNKEDALEIADRVVIIKDGKIIQIDTPENIISNPKSSYVKHLFHY